MSDMRERIAATIQLFLFVFIHFIGFWFGYAFIWFGVGLPQTDWALYVCFALALLSEVGYQWWLWRSC